VNGDPCDDLNGCTSGEICQNGQCLGGSPVTQCINNDGCCPTNCTAQTDLDCGCATLAGPASFTNTISGWPNSGLQFQSLVTGSLQSFTFHNQGLGDTIQLLTMSDQVIGTFSVPPNSPQQLTVNINWPVQSGITYRLINFDGMNGMWDPFTTWPVNNVKISIQGVTDQNKTLQTSWWFTFTDLEVCGG
jgi:hypothetical protein